MPEASSLTVFILAAVVLLVTPGPAVLYIVARSIDQGRIAGLVSVLGISTGTTVHVAGAALGISAILVASATAFSVIKYAGAAYLVYLGIRRLADHTRHDERPVVENVPLSTVFYQGVLVSILNPKTALFFFAFLPQFIDVKAGSPALQILVLGMLFIVMGIVSDGVYAIATGTLGTALRRSTLFRGLQRWASGLILIGLGLAAAFSGSNRSK